MTPKVFYLTFEVHFNVGTPFYMRKAQTSQARALLLSKVSISLDIKFFVMAKLHFRPYIPQPDRSFSKKN